MTEEQCIALIATHLWTQSKSFTIEESVQKAIEIFLLSGAEWLNHGLIPIKARTGEYEMPKIKFTESDLLAATQLEGGWYVLSVKDVSDWTKSKNDPDSNNIIADFIVEGPKKVGVPVRHWFSEKVIGTSMDMLAPYLKCFTTVEAGKDYEPTDTRGRKVEAYIAWNPDRKSNQISDFRPHKGA